MSSSDVHSGDAHDSASEPGTDMQFRTLAERVAKTADPDLKEFLSGILKAAETTMADLNAMREKLDKTKANADAAVAAAETVSKDAGKAAMQADIRAAAHAAGAVDAADVLPFIDLRDVKLDGSSSNITELIGALRKAKPHLFGRISTSATHHAPRPGNSGPRNALEMTTGEYKSAKARFTKR